MQYRLTPEDLRNRLRSLAHNKTFGNCKSRFDSSDVAQEAFIQIWKQHAGEDVGKLSLGWLYAVVNGHAKKLNRAHTAKKRDHRSEERYVTRADSQTKTPAEIAEIKEHLQMLQMIFEGLPKEQQDAIRLRFFVGMTYASMAVSMGQSVYNVQQLVAAAIEAMRREFK